MYSPGTNRVVARLTLGLWARQPAVMPFSLLVEKIALFPHGHFEGKEERKKRKKERRKISLKFFFVYFF